MTSQIFNRVQENYILKIFETNSIRYLNVIKTCCISYTLHVHLGYFLLRKWQKVT